MKILNYQQRIEALKGIENKIEQSAAIDSIVSEMMNENKRVWAINRHIQSYGTWKISLWVNEYTWGHELAAEIKRRCYIITHDEDKEFEMSEFETKLGDICSDYLDNYEPEEEEQQ